MAQKLFVGGLPFATSNDQLRDLFAEIGEVASATVVTYRDTGRSRGFGFVEMSEGGEAAIAALDGTQLDGRTLKVNEAKPKEDRPRSSTGGGYGANRGGGARY